MIHIGNFAIPTEVFMICTCIIMFAVQLVLCTYVKNLLIRLAPVIQFSLSAVTLFIAARSAMDWDALGYLFFAIVAVFCDAACGLAWAFFGIIRFFGRDKSEGKQK